MKNNGFDPNKWSKILDLPYVDRDWKSYRFGGGLGISLYQENGQLPGRVCNLSVKRYFNIRMFLENIRDENWEYSASLYGGLVGFLFKRLRDRIVFKGSSEDTTLSQCINGLCFPLDCKDVVCDIFDKDLDFVAFLNGCNDYIKDINFDMKSALDVYLLQGDDAIFSILMQIFFYQSGQFMPVNVVLTPGLPIVWKPKVSNFVNGTSFPVVVSPWSDSLDWVCDDEGWFLQDTFGAAIDCAGVGLFGCWGDCLGNRLAFCGRSGLVGGFPYVVCRTWGEIVDALKYFGVRNVLVRRMNENLIDTEFFKFGLDALLVVLVRGNGEVYGRERGKAVGGVRIAGQYRAKKYEHVVCSLSGELVSRGVGYPCVWLGEELGDWFLLGSMCRV